MFILLYILVLPEDGSKITVETGRNVYLFMYTCNSLVISLFVSLLCISSFLFVCKLLTLHLSVPLNVNPQYTKPSSSTLFTKLRSSEDPHGFFVIYQLFNAVDYSNYVFWVEHLRLETCRGE